MNWVAITSARVLRCTALSLKINPFPGFKRAGGNCETFPSPSPFSRDFSEYLLFVMMHEQIVSFPPEVNEKVGQYCIDHSVSLPGYMQEHKEYTEQNVANPSMTVYNLADG